MIRAFAFSLLSVLAAQAGIRHPLHWQHIDHPGYNRDRGPADVVNIRLHIEL